MLVDLLVVMDLMVIKVKKVRLVLVIKGKKVTLVLQDLEVLLEIKDRKVK